MRAYPTLLPGLVFKRWTRALVGVGNRLAPWFPGLKVELRHADLAFRPEEYIAASLVSACTFFIGVSALAWIFAAAASISPSWLIGLLVGALFGAFVLFQDILLPRAIIGRKVKSIERNLIPALSDMVVQIKSGVPLFDVLVNISNAEYGAVANEFRKAVRRISTGESQLTVIEDLATSNPSQHFRRMLWQLVNALKTGASVSAVFADSINRLGEEQVIQITTYGGQLNGLTMFYMLTSVIAPALLLTASVVVSFFFPITRFWAIMLFVMACMGVLFLQVVFMGILRTRRPNFL